MNILFIAVIIVFIIFGIIGYVKGLFGVLFNLFSWIFIALFVVVVNPFIYTFIVDNTSWKTSITTSVQTYVDGTIDNATSSLGGNTSPNNGSPQASDVENAMSQYGITLPKAITKDVVSDVMDGVNGTVSSIGDQATQFKNNIVSSVSNTIATYIIRGLACLIAFVIAKIICWIVYAIIKYVQDLPVVKGVTSWLGLILGLVKGLLVTWLFMFIVSITTATSFGQYFIPMIEENVFLRFLYENNMLITAFHYFFG